MTAGISMAQKGPRFQVVRLPGQFTRGRWDCWDYREPEQKHDEGILLYDSSAPASVAASVTTLQAPANQTEAPSTIPITGVHTNSLAISPSTSSFAVTDSNETIIVTSIAQNNEIKNQNVESTQNTSKQRTSLPNAATSTKEQESFTQQTAPSTSQPTLSSSTSGNNLNKLGEETETSNNMGLLNAANVVAIDNKIEQAMDLVKTHLTFAVREEVETLRTTIAELEARVASLDQENQMLRKYAPPEILASLSSILQNGQVILPPVAATATASVISTVTTTTATPTE